MDTPHFGSPSIQRDLSASHFTASGTLSNLSCSRQFIHSHLTLLLGSLQDALLNGAFTYQSVHSDLLCLPQPVCPVHGLLVYCWVPVTVIENYL